MVVFLCIIKMVELPKVKPNHPDRPLLSGCSIGPKPHPLVSGYIRNETPSVM